MVPAIQEGFLMNSQQKQIHERALAVAIQYQRAEAEMVQVLQEADRVRLHRSFGLSSLLKYAIQYLKLSEPVALAFIAVARKSTEVPALKSAVSDRKLSVSAASRLVSILTKENADELMAFAASHAWRETECEIARRNPKAAVPDKAKMLGNGLVQVTLTISESEFKDFDRACSVEAQRQRNAPGRGRVFVAAINTYLDKHDPVRKAERAGKKSSLAAAPALERSAAMNSVRTEYERTKNEKRTVPEVPPGRVPYTATQLHAVHSRDQGRCTHINGSGVRCNQDRWTEIHHIVPVSKGGSNDPENLTTLCSVHHDLAHQLTLPVEGQITWLRSSRMVYRKTSLL
jgi:hypothetical protein